MATKGRYFQVVCYPENMIPDWQTLIGDKLQVPCEYAIHDKDLEGDGKTPRKTHVHINIVWNNTVVPGAVLQKVNDTLSLPDRKCASTIEIINNIRHAHNYLIHDTETCKKQHKHLYDVKERISVNNFDIGNFEQVSVADKNRMAKELADVIVQENFTNFADFYMYVMSNFDMEYFEVIKTYSGLYERLTKGNFQKSQT